MATYTAYQGESLFDVCYNTTGSLAAIDAIMDSNNITTYTPEFTDGVTLTVPDVVYNSNAVTVADAHPFSSTTEPLDFTPLYNILNS